MKCLHSCGFLVALIALSLVGCPDAAGPQQQDETDTGQVKKVAQLFSDMARDPKTFQDQFASGKAPDEKMRQRYVQWYRTWIVEPADPTIEGDRDHPHRGLQSGRSRHGGRNPNLDGGEAG